MQRLTRMEYLAAWAIGLGVVLILIGIRGVRYIPMTADEAKQEEALQLLIRFQEQAIQELDGEHKRMFEENLKRLRATSLRVTREPPYRIWGWVGVGIGTIMLLLGAVGLRNRPRHGRWVAMNEDV